MPVQAHPEFCFQVHLKPKAGLRGEGFEQCRHAADARTVQIGDGVSPVDNDRRPVALCVAVADEEDIGRGRISRGQERSERDAGT
jgi:hypothetical protein